MNRDKNEFWVQKSARQLAREQKIRPVKNLDDLIGKHKGLWKNDAELDEFLAQLHARRKAKSA